MPHALEQSGSFFCSFLFFFHSFFFLFRGGAGPALFVLVPDAHLRNKNPGDSSGNSNGYSNCDGFCNSSMDKENSINDSKKLNNDGMNYLPSWNWFYRRKTKETGVKDKSRFYSVFLFFLLFLIADTRLYKRLFPSIRRSICRSVCR